MSSSIYRSELMGYYQMIFRYETAYECVSELGDLGVVQFEDTNKSCSAVNHKYVSEIRRCDEIERKIRFIEGEIKKVNIKTDDPFIPATPRQKDISKIEAILDKVEIDLLEENSSIEAMEKALLKLVELKHSLIGIQTFFRKVDPRKSFEQLEEYNIQALMEEGKPTKHYRDDQTLINMRLNFLVGVIPRKKIPPFEQMLWRVGRGNILVRFYEIDEDLQDFSTGYMISKSVFIIFCQGDTFLPKINKICEGFHGMIYTCPKTSQEREELVFQSKIALEDLSAVLSKAKRQRHRILVSASKNISTWSKMARKSKAVYHTLNLFTTDISRSALIAKCWIPLADEEAVTQSLKAGIHRGKSHIPVVMNRLITSADPPTYNRTNKFTNGFQALVDAYGMASYREVSPAPFLCITFPFLFAVMFGDSGHGLIMTVFAIWMVLSEKTFLVKRGGSEIWRIFFSGRYVILLMGLFSFYTGLIYNDWFSKSLNIFGSSWSSNFETKEIASKIENAEFSLDPSSPDYQQYPYPFGLDPVWQVSHNSITFINSFKMKIAIILGFIQMFCGVLLSLWNYVHFKTYLNIFCDFIPQILFLTLMFGYLVFLMFFKWIFYGPDNPEETSPGCAPRILITFINMVLFKESEMEGTCSPYMFPNQDSIQKVLVLVAFICIPWMLLIKPIILVRREKQKQSLLSAKDSQTKRRTNVILIDKGCQTSDELTDDLHTNFPEADTNKLLETKSMEHSEEEEGHGGSGEIFIHQAIHTIEYVLGTVSHTASYLRLWALSLAHQQLSDVLWSRILKMGFSTGGSPKQFDSMLLGGLIMYVIFAVWASLTVSILVLMEGLSAFLHTLRLHWVEFQSKFYSGLGHKFMPFCFNDVLEHLAAEKRG